MMYFRCLRAVSALVFLSLAATAHAGRVACVDAFAPKPLSVSILPENVTLSAVELRQDPMPSSKRDAAYNSSLGNLLQMLTETVFESGSQKLTVEKGELRLAKSVGNGQSLEFEYTGDKRTGETVLHLSKIVLYKPNGHTVTVEKNPVSDDGKRLTLSKVALLEVRKNTADGENVEFRALEATDLAKWSAQSEESKTALKGALKDNEGEHAFETLENVSPLLSIRDQAKIAKVKSETLVVQVPVAIQGALLNELIGWLDRMPHVSRVELRRSIANGRLRELTWKAQLRSQASFSAKVAKKQIFKFAMLAAVVAGVEHLPVAQNFVIHLPGSNRLEQLLHAGHKSLQKSEEQLAAKVVVDAHARTATPIAQTSLMELINKSRTIPTGSEIRKFETLVGQLSDSEVSLGGKPLFYSEEVPMAGSNHIEGVTQGYLVAEFRKQERLLLVPILHAGDASAPELTVLDIDKKSFPSSYNALISSIDSKSK